MPIQQAILLLDRLRDLRQRLIVEGIEKQQAKDDLDWANIFRGELVYIILPDNSHITVRFNPAHSVLKLKSEIERQTGIPRNVQVLYLNTSAEAFRNTQKLAFYGIVPGCSILLVGIEYLRDSDGIYQFKVKAR